MLQQILKELRVDPQLLAELSDEQKQELFSRMREEQVRRWKAREDVPDSDVKKRPTATFGGKRVRFLVDSDGEPIVDVFGDEPEEQDMAISWIEVPTSTVNKVDTTFPDDVLEEQLTEPDSLASDNDLSKHQENNHDELRRRTEAELTALLRFSQEQIQAMEQEQQQFEESLKGESEAVEEDDVMPDNNNGRLNSSHTNGCAMLDNLISSKEDWPIKFTEMVYTPEKPYADRQLCQNKVSAQIAQWERWQQENNQKQWYSGSQFQRLIQQQPAKIPTFHLLSWPDKLKTDNLLNVAQPEQRSLEDLELNEICHQTEEQSQATEQEVEKLLRERDKRTRCSVGANIGRHQTAESQIREIARRAREEHRRNSLMSDSDSVSPTSSSSSISSSSPVESPTLMSPLFITSPEWTKNNSNLENGNIHQQQQRNSTNLRIDGIKQSASMKGTKPLDRDAIIKWFRTGELKKGAGLQMGSKKVATWFHGLITRSEAEELLDKKAPGSFLVRVSERIWGYVLSYRSDTRCKHFLVDASDGRYRFFGTAHIPHPTLGSLIQHHSRFPITLSGKELLDYPCPQPTGMKEFVELFREIDVLAT